MANYREAIQEGITRATRGVGAGLLVFGMGSGDLPLHLPHTGLTLKGSSPETRSIPLFLPHPTLKPEGSISKTRLQPMSDTDHVFIDRVKPNLPDGGNLPESILAQYAKHTFIVQGEPIVLLDESLLTQTDRGTQLNAKLNAKFIGGNNSLAAVDSNNNVIEIKKEIVEDTSLPSKYNVYVNGTYYDIFSLSLYVTGTGEKPVISPNGELGVESRTGEILSEGFDKSGERLVYRPIPAEKRYFVTDQIAAVRQNVQASQGIEASPENVDIVFGTNMTLAVALMIKGPHGLDANSLRILQGVLANDPRLVNRLALNDINVIGSNPNGSNPVDSESGTLYIDPKNPESSFRNLEIFNDGVY